MPERMELCTRPMFQWLLDDRWKDDIEVFSDTFASNAWMYRYPTSRAQLLGANGCFIRRVEDLE
jgi:hypothetical protein